MLLNPWFVHKSFFVIAVYPIGARDENSTVPFGRIVADELFNPAAVIFLAPRDIYLSLKLDKSSGVIQGMLPLKTLAFVLAVYHHLQSCQDQKL